MSLYDIFFRDNWDILQFYYTSCDSISINCLQGAYIKRSQSKEDILKITWQYQEANGTKENITLMLQSMSKSMIWFDLQSYSKPKHN